MADFGAIKPGRHAERLTRALFAWEVTSAEPGVFVSQPNIPIAGTADGIAWGHLRVPADRTAWLVPMTVDPVPVRLSLLVVGCAGVTLTMTPFYEREFWLYRSGARSRVRVFVCNGTDPEKVAAVLDQMTPTTP